MRRVPRYITDLLEASGLRWSAEDGSRHVKILVEGRLVQTLPRASSRSGTTTHQRNAIASIRRAIREHGGVVR